jgi:hypothetical protein
MQDEPEAELGFSHKMSLKDRMLGIDRQHGRFRQVEPGTDPAFLEASGEVGFQAQDRTELYGWVERTLATTTTRSFRAPPKGCCGAMWPR